MEETMSKKKIFLITITTILFGMVLIVIGYFGKIYMDIKKTADRSYESVERISESKRNKYVDYAEGDAFSILLIGTDSGDYGREDQGRSDVLIVATVNPTNKTTTLLSIPRDTYADIIGKNTKDKINHAYAYGGVPMAIASVENLLDIPIDHYAQVDLKGIKEIVDAVGGIEVNNKFSFKYGTTEFPIGKLSLDGEKALQYSRMRYDDPKGDYGRQERQRQVITGILNKVKSLDTLTNYDDLLEILGDNFKTDLSWQTLKLLFENYRVALTNIESQQLVGEGFTGDGVTGEQGISYQKISDDELMKAKKNLKEQLNISES
ncbi:LCP family glycopolymer transferase [Enterococcus villorum]|nr:LCP family protein [Enterococcus villorum]